MLDRWSLQLVRPPLRRVARGLSEQNIKADQVTLFGFALGMLAAVFIAMDWTLAGLVFIVLNRTCDGLDGELARLQQPTNRGAYLDIVLDFIFYSAVVFAFAVADPAQNALPAAALIFSFMGTGSSFLAFAILAERLQLSSMRYPSKGFYYLNGITEGTETIGFFVLMCLLPSWFPVLAWIFFGLCTLTTITRVIGGAHTLNSEETSG